MITKKGMEKIKDDCIAEYLSQVKNTKLFGKPILSYSKKELAAFIAFQAHQIDEAMIERSENFKILRGR